MSRIYKSLHGQLFLNHSKNEEIEELIEEEAQRLKYGAGACTVGRFDQNEVLPTKRYVPSWW